MKIDTKQIAALIEQAYDRIATRQKLPSHGYLTRVDQQIGLHTSYSPLTIKQYRLGRANYLTDGARQMFDALCALGEMPLQWRQAVAKQVGYAIGGGEEVMLHEFVGENRPTYFVGRAQELKAGLAALRSDESVGVAIEGLGGIGKTRLARQLTEQCRAEFEQVVVVNAKPRLAQQFSAETLESILDALRTAFRKPNASVEQLSGQLNQTRTLLVLDNLETAQQPQGEIVEQLIPMFGYSKLLATSRHRFRKDIQRISLRGLNQSAAFELMRQVATGIGFIASDAIPEESLTAIFKQTGGSPLAMRFVLSQLEESSLEIVLERLTKFPALDQITDEDEYHAFYRHLFFFSWSQLSEDGRLMLLALAHVTSQSGITLSDLQAVIGREWSRAKVDSVRGEVWRRSFLEILDSNGLGATRYYLHPLVVHFIESRVAQTGGWHE